jgi:hypothetical protein
MHPTGEIAMLKFWSTYYEAVRFACEAQGVMSARLILLASGDPRAVAETYRMFSEKAIAFADAQSAAERALADGCGIYEAVEQAYLPLCHCVHENSQRLLSAAH